MTDRLELLFTDTDKLERAAEERKTVLESKVRSGVPKAQYARSQRHTQRRIRQNIERG